MYDYLDRPRDGYFGPRWWMTLHMIQTPMIGLVAGGPLLFMSSLTGFWPWVFRAMVLVFIVYCTVLDSIGGISSAGCSAVRSMPGVSAHTRVGVVPLGWSAEGGAFGLGSNFDEPLQQHHPFRSQGLTRRSAAVAVERVPPRVQSCAGRGRTRDRRSQRRPAIRVTPRPDLTWSLSSHAVDL